MGHGSFGFGRLRFIGRPRRATGALIVAVWIFFGSSPVTADTPTPLWRDATQIGIRCLVEQTSLLNPRALESAICERVRDEVTRDSVLPVAVILPGDPALIAAGTVALLVHVSVQHEPGDGQRYQVVFVIRPHRAIAEQQGPLFGAPPETASLSADGRIGAAFDSALGRALSQTLPWRAVAQRQDRPL